MNEILREKCNLLAENKQVIAKTIKWKYNLLEIAGSILYTSEGKAVDAQKLKECEEILKKHEGILSDFRSNMEIPILCKMALSENPEETLLHIKEVYKMVTKGRILTSSYHSLTACAIFEKLQDEDADRVLAKAKEIYNRMSQKHPFLTGDDDLVHITLLALTDKSVDEIIEETESSYKILHDTFYAGNGLQSLSHVLALMEGSTEEKCQRVVDVYHALKARKIKLDQDYMLSSLGLFVNCDASPEEIAGEIEETANLLKESTGFGDWTIGTGARNMLAALLVSQSHTPENNVAESAILRNALSVVIAEEEALMVAIIVSSSAAYSACY